MEDTHAFGVVFNENDLYTTPVNQYAVYRRISVQQEPREGDLYFVVGYRLASPAVVMDKAIQIATQIVADEFPRSAYNGELLVEVDGAGRTSRVNILHHGDERFGYGAQLPLVVLRLIRGEREAAPQMRETLKASYWRR